MLPSTNLTSRKYQSTPWRCYNHLQSNHKHSCFVDVLLTHILSQQRLMTSVYGYNNDHVLTYWTLSNLSYHLFTKQNNRIKLQGFNEPGHVKVLLKCYGLRVCAGDLACLELLVGSALAAGGGGAVTGPGTGFQPGFPECPWPSHPTGWEARCMSIRRPSAAPRGAWPADHRITEQRAGECVCPVPACIP